MAELGAWNTVSSFPFFSSSANLESQDSWEINVELAT